MFTFIENYKTLFMMGVCNTLETPVAAYDSNNDGDILDPGEMQAILESNDKKEIAKLTEVDTLEAAVNIAPSSPVNRQSPGIEQKKVQYLATKILKLTGQTVRDGSIDGKIGRGSIADIALASGIDLTDAEVGMDVISALIAKAGELVSTKREELAQSEVEKIQNLQIIADFDPSANNSEDDIKVLQQALIDLGQSLRGSNNGVDGDYGGSTKRAYDAMLPVAQQQVLQDRVEAANTAVDNIQGPHDARAAIQEQQEVQGILENLRSVEHALRALEGVKKDKDAVKAIQEAVGVGIDGITGPNTKAAVEANPEAALTALAQYIDATDNAEVEARVVSERPADGDAIDAAINDLFDDDIEDMEGALAKLAAEFTAKDLGSGVRNRNAQYIALKLQSLGLENSPMAQSLMEKILVEGKGHYEAETAELDIRQALYDGSGRFARSLGRFPENFTGSYYRVRQALQSQGGRERIENAMETGTSGTADSILRELFGVNADFVASRLHVVTGQGTDGDADMSLELAGGIILEHAYYDERSGAIYATVAEGNGCEGNLVVIPVETFAPPVVITPPVVPPVVPPVEPPKPPKPEPENNQSSDTGNSGAGGGGNGGNGGGTGGGTGGR